MMNATTYMKKIVFLLPVMVVCSVVSAQCYEPNLRKGDAAYEAGNIAEAYNAYRNATKCPDAARFEDGKAAKEGMRKCMPSLTIDGNRGDFTIQVGPEAGSRRLSVVCKNLLRWTAFARSMTWVTVNQLEYHVDISWTANNSRQERKNVVVVWGNDLLSGLVQREITIVQAGKVRSLLVEGGENYTIEAPHSPYTKSLRVTSKNAWEYKVADADTAWVHVTPKGGSLTVKLAANMGMPGRTGSIVVSSAGEKSVVTVKQAADPKFREEDYASQAYMDIKDIVFGNNFDGDGSVGNHLYTDNITWMDIHARYDGKTSVTRKLDSVYFKIYKPGGKLSTGSKSPQGYSIMWPCTIRSGSNQLSYLTGWGNETGRSYTYAGEYRCEIWYRGKMLFSKTLVLKDRPHPVFTGIDFVAVDAEGKELGPYGNTFSEEDIVYLKPRVHYNYDGPVLKGKRYNVRLKAPDGSIVGRGYRTILKQGKSVAIDSSLYRDYVAEIVPGKGMTFTLAPFSCKYFKNNPGVYTLQLLAGTENIQTSAQLVIRNSSYGYFEYVLPPSAGVSDFLMGPSIRTGKYSIDVVEDNSITQHYEYAQGEGRLTTAFPSKASIAVEFMTDSSFYVRHLSKPRGNCKLTIKNEVYTAVASFTTTVDDVKMFRSRQQKLPIETVRGVRVDLVYVEGGTVVIGKTVDIQAEAGLEYFLPYRYTTKGFYIMRRPVTQKLWKEIMGSEPVLGWTKKEGKGDDYTAYNISAAEAKLFVAKLNAKTGMKFSLPNSQEWLYARSGGMHATKWGGADDFYCPSADKYHEWIYNEWSANISHTIITPCTIYTEDDCKNCIKALRLVLRVDE